MLELYLDLQNPTPVPGVAVRGQGGEVFNNGQQRLSGRERRLRRPRLPRPDQRPLPVRGHGAFFMRGTDLIELTNVLFDPLPGARNPGGLIDVGRFRFANDPFATEVYGVEAALRVSPIEGLDLFATTPSRTPSHSGHAPRGRPAHAAAQGSTSAPSCARASASTSRSPALVSSQVWREQDFDAARGVVYVTYDLDTYLLQRARRAIAPARPLEFGVTGTNLTDNRARQHPFGAPSAPG
jgi:hypothetical protein